MSSYTQEKRDLMQEISRAENDLDTAFAKLTVSATPKLRLKHHIVENQVSWLAIAFAVGLWLGYVNRRGRRIPFPPAFTSQRNQWTNT
jgi:hypothetical protein